MFWPEEYPPVPLLAPGGRFVGGRIAQQFDLEAERQRLRECPSCGRKARWRRVRLVHDQAVVQCPEGHRDPKSLVKRWYLNTGTWQHKYGIRRRLLLREDLEFPFVRMIDTHRVLASRADDYMEPRPEARPRVELLRWNDEAQRVEVCETFKGTDEA